jgi:hypothetical protein
MAARRGRLDWMKAPPYVVLSDAYEPPLESMRAYYVHAQGDRSVLASATDLRYEVNHLKACFATFTAIHTLFGRDCISSSRTPEDRASAASRLVAGGSSHSCR